MDSLDSARTGRPYALRAALYPWQHRVPSRVFLSQRPLQPGAQNGGARNALCHCRLLDCHGAHLLRGLHQGHHGRRRAPRPSDPAISTLARPATFEGTALITRIAEIYDGGEARLATLVPEGWLAERKRLLAEVEAYTDGWIAAASEGLSVFSTDGSAIKTASASTVVDEAPLNAVPTPKSVNMVVTASHWVAALGKLLLFGLSEHVRACDVFSAAHRTKTAAFEAALGKHATELAAKQLPGEASEDLPTAFAVGDGDEEATAAANLTIPFVRVRTASDLSLTLSNLSAPITRPNKDTPAEPQPKRFKASLEN